jgi:hypothetical protein
MSVRSMPTYGSPKQNHLLAALPAADSLRLTPCNACPLPNVAGCVAVSVQVSLRQSG